MAIVKKRNEQIESRLLLESDEPIELPPAEIEESALIVQFEQHKPFVAELLDSLREGTIAEIVPVMRDGSTFAIHTATRTFWVKLWHSSAERTRIERAQVIGCLPSARGVRIIAQMEEEDSDGEEIYDDEDDSFEMNDAEEAEHERDADR